MFTPAVPASSQSVVRTALAGLIGNVLEWFDFAIYGFFTDSIGKQFFPKTDPINQQIDSLIVFALGFFARPIGGIVLGSVGDRIGRRTLLTLSIVLMGGSTLAIGLLPTYARIGVAAPISLAALRLIQGFSLGSEFTGSMVYTTELAPPQQRGLVSSSTAAGTTLGFILGAATAGLVEATIDSDWGWRIPYIGSVLLCVAGWLLRRGVQESPESEKAAAIRTSLWRSLISDWRPIVQVFGIVAMTNAAYYLAFTYVVERRKASADYTSSAFLFATTLSLITLLISKPLGGWLSDRLGRRRLMLVLTIVTMAVACFALNMMLYGAPRTFMLGQIILGVPVGMALGLQGAMVVEIFPLRTRVSSMSFAYGVTLALSGGVFPAMSAWLTKVVGQPMAPAYYMILYGVIGLALMWRMKETNTAHLDK